MTRVDELQIEIKNIQESCAPHQFRMTSLPMLLESNVLGVYIGTCEGGQAELKQNPNRSNFNPRFSIKCITCSLEKKCTVMGTCPVCYGAMKTDHHLESREKYYGVSYTYYMAKLHSCEACNFRSVSEEFDQ